MKKLIKNKNLRRKAWKESFNKTKDELNELAIEAEINRKFVKYKMDKDKLRSISKLLSSASKYYEDLSERVIKKKDFLKE